MISENNIKPQRLLLHSQQVFDTWYRPPYVVVILLCKGTKLPVTYYSSRNVSKAFQNFFGVSRTLSKTQPIFNLQLVASQRLPEGSSSFYRCMSVAQNSVWFSHLFPRTSIHSFLPSQDPVQFSCQLLFGDPKRSVRAHLLT